MLGPGGGVEGPRRRPVEVRAALGGPGEGRESRGRGERRRRGCRREGPRPGPPSRPRRAPRGPPCGTRAKGHAERAEISWVHGRPRAGGVELRVAAAGAHLAGREARGRPGRAIACGARGGRGSRRSRRTGGDVTTASTVLAPTVRSRVASSSATRAAGTPGGRSAAKSARRRASSSVLRAKRRAGKPAAIRRGEAAAEVSDARRLTFTRIALRTSSSASRTPASACPAMPARIESSSRSTCGSNAATSSGG